MENNTRMGRVFRALGDVHRLQILDMLSEQEMNAGEILEAVDVVQSTLSHHMKTLTDAGLVGARRSGKWTYYTVNETALEEAGDFLRSYYAHTVREKTAEKTTEKVIRKEPEKSVQKKPKSAPVSEKETPAPPVPEVLPLAEEDDIFGSGSVKEPVKKASEKKSGKKDGKKGGKKDGKKSGKKSKKK